MSDEKPPRTEFEVLPANRMPTPPERKELTIRDEMAIAAKKPDDKLRSEAQMVAESMVLAADIDDDVVDPETGTVLQAAEVPAEWTKRQKRIAKDARRSNKDAPVYLKAMLDLHRAYVAADAARPAEASGLNIGAATNVTINVLHQYGAVDYPVKKVEE